MTSDPQKKALTIAIYGGSFNPIHKGHTCLASQLVQQGLVDEVWLLVSPLNPLKRNDSKCIAPYEHRLRMAELAIEGMVGLRVSDFESQLPVPSYTITTLDTLSQAYPEHTFVLVIGADNWASFHRWYRADDIIARYPIIIYRRPGYPIDESTLPPHVTIANTDVYDISSTEIRAGNTRGFLDDKVAEYIHINKLYQ